MRNHFLLFVLAFVVFASNGVLSTPATIPLSKVTVTDVGKDASMRNDKRLLRSNDNAIEEERAGNIFNGWTEKWKSSKFAEKLKTGTENIKTTKLTEKLKAGTEKIKNWKLTEKMKAGTEKIKASKLATKLAEKKRISDVRSLIKNGVSDTVLVEKKVTQDEFFKALRLDPKIKSMSTKEIQALVAKDRNVGKWVAFKDFEAKSTKPSGL